VRLFCQISAFVAVGANDGPGSQFTCGKEGTQKDKWNAVEHLPAVLGEEALFLEECVLVHGGKAHIVRPAAADTNKGAAVGVDLKI